MLESLTDQISFYLYSYILIILLIGGGVYFFVRMRALPLRLLPESIRVVMQPASDGESISSFRALMVSTASRVGVGNIAGVSTAIALGGAGSVFWMWLIAMVGSASAFIESTLAQIYKKRDKDGSSFGGPAFYIHQALNNRTLAVTFALALILTYLGGFNMVASFNVADAFSSYGIAAPSFVPSGMAPYFLPLIIGILLAVAMGLAIFWGTKHLSLVTAVLVPIMALLYIGLCLVIVVLNLGSIPAIIADIFAKAFDLHAIFGSFAGSAVMFGIKRGLYSNEAGVGSAPNAAASASVSHPVKQGLVQMLSVWIDTMLVCTATAFGILASGVAGGENLKGAPLVQEAMASTYGSLGHYFVTFSLCIFAFTTIIGNYYYAEVNLRFLLGHDVSQKALAIFRTVGCLIVIAGTMLEFTTAWNIADILMGVMALINMPVILYLGKQAIDAGNDYVRQRREGKEPEYIAAENGITAPVDFWK